MSLYASFNGTLGTTTIPRRPEILTLQHEKVRLGNVCYIKAEHKGLIAAVDAKIYRIERYLKREESGQTRVLFGDPIMLGSDYVRELEGKVDWKDKRRRQLDRGRGGQTVTVASEDTSKAPWYARVIIRAGETVNDRWAEIMALLPDNGGQVVFLDGQYDYDGTMEITKNKVHISGQGEGTKFKLKAGIDNHTYCFYASHKTGIKISDLLIDGNKNNQNELGYLHHGVCLYYCEKYELNRLIIENFITTCIYDSHGVNGSIESCVTHNSDDIGIMMSYSSYVSVKNNNIRGNLKRGLYMINCEHCSVVGNVIDQIGGLHEGLAVWWSNNNVFSSNTINGCGGSGAYISASKYNNFIGNTFNNNAYEGLQLAGYAEIESSHNIISGNTCIGNGSNGIYINGSYNNLQNNKCYNNDYYGIYISWVNGVNNLVTNNDLIDNVAGGLMDFGTGTVTTAGNRV